MERGKNLFLSNISHSITVIMGITLVLGVTCCYQEFIKWSNNFKVIGILKIIKI